MESFSYNASDDCLELSNGAKISLTDPEAFAAISELWLRCGWDTKYVYGFSWLGRPIIQLPEDIIRVQELIYQVQPDVIVETGVAHGGSLIFYASLFAAIGKGKVIGVDIDIRPHNRKAIQDHRLSSLISLIEGSSTDSLTIQLVKEHIQETDTVLVILDSNHSKDHVKAELELYSPLITVGSYIVACDGIMQQVAGAPRTSADWSWNNPVTAIDEFLAINPQFQSVEPAWPFNESAIKDRVTYWPKSFLLRSY